MNTPSLSLSRSSALRAVVAAACLLAGAAAQAQSYGPTYVGGAIGSTDYDVGVKVFLGGKVTSVFGWEGQVLSFGSDDYGPGRKHSAMAVGGSGTARLQLAPQLSGFGKAGLHYLRTRYSGPGTPANDSSIELGVGAGLIWNFSHTGALRVEYENIGGGDGDMFSVGVQFSF